MHEFAAAQDTEKSWPVGITGFGLGVIDQPRTKAAAGTEALAGIAAAPARATATRRTDTFAAVRLILPSRERRRPAALSRTSWSLQCFSRSLRDRRAMLCGRKADNGAAPPPGWEGRGRARL